jgi:hypothetical protein
MIISADFAPTTICDNSKNHIKIRLYSITTLGLIRLQTLIHQREFKQIQIDFFTMLLQSHQLPWHPVVPCSSVVRTTLLTHAWHTSSPLTDPINLACWSPRFFTEPKYSHHRPSPAAMDPPPCFVTQRTQLFPTSCRQTLMHA